MSILTWQWIVLLLFSAVMIAITPFIKDNMGFYRGTSKKAAQPGFIMLTFSLVISWIFAKSITNAANLGLSFGIVGGIAYASYYFSFLVAGIVIYKMRIRLKIKSLHEFINNKFGKTAVKLFTIVIAIRLLNEVWSNTEVIGTYFGAVGSPQYIASIVVFTLLTLVYALKGGLRSSLITDLLQMALFAFLLIIVLYIIIPKGGSVSNFISTGEWSLSTGVNLLLVALIQVFSYPFHDPVLTDRGFISDEMTTLKSFIASTIIGFAAIFLFSFVGIYAQMLGVKGQAAVEVSKTLGIFTAIIMNFIMITSASSTVDSTFASVSKMAVMDIGKKEFATVSKGRWIMTIAALAGTIPLLFSPEILSATTISGTMVLGLAPIFIFWKLPAPKISFHLALCTGVVAGIILTFGLLPESLYISEGKYADLLSINIYATILILIFYLTPALALNFSQRDEIKHTSFPFERGLK